MRSENQPFDAIRLWVEIVLLGVGQTGLTVTGVVRRISDGLYLQTAGTWGATAQNVTLTAYDATNFPGVYTYAIATGDLDATLGAEGYEVKITETTNLVKEHILVVPQ